MFSAVLTADVTEWFRSRPGPTTEEAMQIQANFLNQKMLVPPTPVQRPERWPLQTAQTDESLRRELRLAQHGNFGISKPSQWGGSLLRLVLDRMDEDPTIHLGVAILDDYKNVGRILLGPLGEVFQDGRFVDVLPFVEETQELLRMAKDLVLTQLYGPQEKVWLLNPYGPKKVFEIAKEIVDIAKAILDEEWISIRIEAAFLRLLPTTGGKVGIWNTPMNDGVSREHALLWLDTRMSEMESLRGIGLDGRPYGMLLEATEEDVNKIADTIPRVGKGYAPDEILALAPIYYNLDGGPGPAADGRRSFGPTHVGRRPIVDKFPVDVPLDQAEYDLVKKALVQLKKEGFDTKASVWKKSPQKKWFQKP